MASRDLRIPFNHPYSTHCHCAYNWWSPGPCGHHRLLRGLCYSVYNTCHYGILLQKNGLKTFSGRHSEFITLSVPFSSRCLGRPYQRVGVCRYCRNFCEPRCVSEVKCVLITYFCSCDPLIIFIFSPLWHFLQSFLRSYVMAHLQLWDTAIRCCLVVHLYMVLRAIYQISWGIWIR